MNRSTRAAAIAAAATLAVSGATGTASAQDFGSIGDLLDPIGAILDPFTGSAGDLAGGSAGLSPLGDC